MFHSALMKKTFQLFEGNNQLNFLFHGQRFCIPAVHIISFCVSLLSRVDELNKLAFFHCMGLHSSAGRALQGDAEATGSNPVEPRKTFFRATSQLFKLRFNCDGHTFISQVYLHRRPLVRCTFYGSFSKATLGS